MKVLGSKRIPSDLSDNTKTFKAFSKEVVKLTRAAEVQCYLTNNWVT